MTKELRRQAMALHPVVSIGKNGITNNSLDQITKNLRTNKLTKIKILRTFLDETGKDKKVVAKEIAYETQSELIQVIGLTAVLYKK